MTLEAITSDAFGPPLRHGFFTRKGGGASSGGFMPG